MSGWLPALGPLKAVLFSNIIQNNKMAPVWSASRGTLKMDPKPGPPCLPTIKSQTSNWFKIDIQLMINILQHADQHHDIPIPSLYTTTLARFFI